MSSLLEKLHRAVFDNSLKRAIHDPESSLRKVVAAPRLCTVQLVSVVETTDQEQGGQVRSE